MRDPAAKRLDDISADLADVLRHADALLDEWARFGATVRTRRSNAKPRAVAAAVADATGVAIERAASTHSSPTSSAEVAQLEQRVRAASRFVADQRATDRRLLGGIAGGVAVAIALLVVLVACSWRRRRPPVAPEPDPDRGRPHTATADARPADAPVDAAPPEDAAPMPADAARPPRHR